MLNGIKAWFNQPFKSDMDVVHWFLFFGLVIGLLTAWGIILKRAA